MRALLQRLRAGSAGRAPVRARFERLRGEWAGDGRGGERFIEDHAYARDLDLFGRGSLFRAAQHGAHRSRRRHAGSLAAHRRADREVPARQAAVDELRTKLDFREDLAVLAAEAEVSRTGSLSSWAGAPPAGFADRRGRRRWRACAATTRWRSSRWCLPRSLPGRYLVFWLISRRRVRLASGAAGSPRGGADRRRPIAIWRCCAALLARIEREPFQSPRLAACRSALFTQGVPPSRRIAQLRSPGVVARFDAQPAFRADRHALLLPQQLAVAIDRWHARHGRRVARWLAASASSRRWRRSRPTRSSIPADPFPSSIEAGPCSRPPRSAIR